MSSTSLCRLPGDDSSSSDPADLTAVNGKLYFTAQGTHGRAVWVLNPGTGGDS